jgi:tetratricopeptide (TPR) repeat protein
MNRRFLILASLLLFGGLFFAWIAYKWVNAPPTLPAFSMSDFGTNKTQPAAMPIAAIDPSRQIRLAIGSLGLPDDSQNRELGDLITADLGSAKGLQLVERQSLDRVLREAELSLSGLVRAKDAIRVGKLLRADWFLLGGVASAGGSNAVVARIVDARTGIMRDVDVFPYDKATPQLADKLAGFVRQCRQAASGSKPREYLAIGVFQDVSVNNRQADFAAQLRAHLTAAYRGTDMKLLEREYVEALLNEVHLDLAGLTEEGGTNPPPRMQSAFWLVDGYYQSYERTNFEVELVLNVQRIFGGRTRLTFRGRPGEPLFKEIREAMNASFKTKALAQIPTRSSEARAQLNAGAELMQFDSGPFGQARLTTWGYPGDYYGLSQQDMARRRRNVEEAMRAFQSALLLEPTNRQAKVYLAACFRNFVIGRMNEARDIYREVLDESMTSKWSYEAKDALHWSFEWASPDEKARWLEAAAQTCTNAVTAEFFRGEAEKAARDVAIQQGEGPKVQQLAEERLYERIQSFDRGEFYQFSIGMDAFAETFGTNHAAAAQRLAELFPKMKALAPNSAPYLLATIVTFQVDTNEPIIGEFERTLDWCAEHPDQVPKRTATTFWNHISYAVYDWSWEHKVYGLSAKILEAKFRARAIHSEVVPEVSVNHDKMSLAYIYLAMEQWQKSLTVFESYSNQPVLMGSSGPWGPAFTVIRTSRSANYCRKKMGLPEVHDPREFDMGDPPLCLCTPPTPDGRPSSTFSATADGLWIGAEGKLIQLDFNLTTNLAINLPMGTFIPITTLCVGSSNIWIGTDGAGLVEFDKMTHQCRRLTEKDGLMQDFILTLHLSGDALWIGYKNGLGRLDLPTHRVTSFTPTLTVATGTANRQPPRGPIVSIASGEAPDIWIVTQNALHQYHSRDDVWESFADVRHCNCVAGNETGTLFVGMGPYGSSFKKDVPKGLGVNTLNLKEKQWHASQAVYGLPTEQVSTMTVDGQNLWVGGFGYVALVDPAQDKVLKFAYVKARNVDKIQVGGGFVWAQFDWHLYRGPLN